MKQQDIYKETFKKGSKTYFNSSLFFPASVRRDVFRLYGFVRTADDFVDSTPQDTDGFYDFKTRYRAAMNGQPTGDPIIDGYAELSLRKGFKPAWTDAFLRSMEMDLHKNEYNTLEETLEYIYGSAEVIGFFMSRILGLPEEAYPYAALQGRAMQYINFIRDIKEDWELGRRYLPLENTGLKKLNPAYAERHPELFKQFHSKQIHLYRSWQKEAEKGYTYIPRRYRIPIKTAARMYMWTAEQIEQNPFIVFTKQVKPSRPRIYLSMLHHIFTG